MDGLQVVVDEVSTSVYLKHSHDYILASYFTITLDFHIPFQYIFVCQMHCCFLACKNTKSCHYMKNSLSITIILTYFPITD
jgi:hypothetical protein